MTSFIMSLGRTHQPLRSALKALERDLRGATYSDANRVETPFDSHAVASASEAAEPLWTKQPVWPDKNPGVTIFRYVSHCANADPLTLIFARFPWRPNRGI